MIETSNLRQYTRNASCLEIKSHLIRLKDYDAHLQLKVPDYKIDSSPVEICRYENLQENAWYLVKTLNAHFDFCLSISPSPGQRDDVALKRSIASVNTISLLFPDTRNQDIMICMVAWLETLCAVDDRLEDMKSEDAGDAIEEAIAVLRDEPIHTPRHTGIIQTIAKFKSHCIKYHCPSLLNSFFAEIDNVLIGLLQEIHFKNGTLSQSLDTYISIRRKTIGIKPFFALIRSAHGQPYPFNDKVTQLQSDISVIAGLQNDLLGLEKDIRTGEEMNAVVFFDGKYGSEES